MRAAISFMNYSIGYNVIIGFKLDSLFLDESKSTLDTVHEATGGSKPPNNNTSRVWVSAIGNTDVVGAMEAVEGCNVEREPKDKSMWRKSVLNQAHSLEAAELEARRLRRTRSRSNIEPSQTLTALQVCALPEIF